MPHDTLKVIFTYSIAIIVIVGSGLLLRFPPVGIPPEALLAFVISVTSLVLGYVFGERSSAAGAATVIASQPTVTTTAGPPPTTTVTPAGTGDAPEGIG